MSYLKEVIPILIATIWISLSEFIRNDVLLKSFWVNHYKDIGLIFPSKPLNGAIWGLWSLLFAISIYIISKKFSTLGTTFIAWLMGFVLMWVTIGNLNVLPPGLLLFAIPLSLLEAFIATWLIKNIKFEKTNKKKI